MRSAWSLRHAAVERPLEAWGIAGLQRRRSSQAVDLVGFSVDGAAFDAEAPFAAGDEVTILRDGIQWFVGRVISLARSASGRAESISYQVAGPWWYLDRLVYQQVWHVYGGGEVRQSHALLNTYADGASMGVRAQLDEALTWASARAAERYGSAPFQWNSASFPDASIPADEIRDTTAAEVIRKQLRWVPDAVCWWEYSTTPPTFRVARRADLEEAEISGPSSRISDISLSPRHDLLTPSVVLKYEKIDTVDGVSYPSLTVDAAPPGADGTEFGCLTATIDLRGAAASYARASITTVALPNTNDEIWSWLKKKQPYLDSNRISLVSIVSVKRHPSDDPESTDVLPRELIDGQIPDWMDTRAQQETVTVRAQIRVDDAAGNPIDVVTKDLAVNLNTTTAASGEYSQVQSVEAGEVPPVGLAAVLHEALSVLEWEGSFTIVDEEVHGGPTIGQRVNLIGWRSEWEAMGAVVQEVSEDVDSGTTSIRVGPPQHLGPRDLVELLRVNRFRVINTPRSERAGAGTSRSGVGLGRTMRMENGTGASTAREKLVIQYGGGSINLDGQLTLGKEITVREISICVDGVAKRMLIIASEPYTA